MRANYEIRVAGHLDALWWPWFAGLQLTHLPEGQTQLCGSVVDQAALHGLLARIRDLNLTLIAVRRLEHNESLPSEPRP